MVDLNVFYLSSVFGQILSISQSIVVVCGGAENMNCLGF